MPRQLLAALTVALTACLRLDSCFAGSTLISTPRGRRRIRDLVVGDEVWSFDPKDTRFAVGVVAAIHHARGEVRSVRSPGRAIGAVTASHPLFVASREVFAADVAVGETLLAWDDSPEARPVATPIVELVPAAVGDTIEVFNLTVARAFSTYFADGFLVHNKDPSPSCDDWSKLPIALTTARNELCSGESTPISIEGFASENGCLTVEEFKRIVIATSDPSIVGIEQLRAIGHRPGSATIDLLLDGQKRSSRVIAVRACVTDAGSDVADSTADSSASDSDAGDTPD